MRYRWIGTLLVLVALLWLLSVLLYLDPVRAGLAALLIYGGYRLVRSGGGVGVLHLMDREYPLQDMALSCGIADVKIDLSRAIIPPGEHLITIRGLVGDVTIYVPYDLDVAIEAVVPVGRLNLPGHDRKGAGRRRTFMSGGYAQAVSKVKIAVSLTVGDVDVRYL